MSVLELVREACIAFPRDDGRAVHQVLVRGEQNGLPLKPADVRHLIERARRGELTAEEVAPSDASSSQRAARPASGRTRRTRQKEGRKVAADPVHAAAREAYNAGLCVLPTAEDGSKRPIGPRAKWKHFQTRRPTSDELRRWYPGRYGLGMIAGEVSGRVECWDFDDRETFDAFIVAAAELGLGGVVDRLDSGYRDDTPGHGVRWLARYPEGIEREGQIILARRPKRPQEIDPADPDDNVKTLIELPLHAILAPTNGKVHPSGKPYVRRSGGFGMIASYTAEERNALMMLARSFDVPIKPIVVSDPALARGSGGTRPGDMWGAATPWSAILQPAGWTKVFARGATTYWRRPGKKEGWSATTGHTDSDTLSVFSTSTPFESVLETKKTYSKFAAFAILEHRGDFTAAAKALADLGFGEQSRKRERRAEQQRAAHPPANDDPSPAPNGFTPPSHWQSFPLSQLDTWDVEPFEPVVDGLFVMGSLVDIGAETQTGKSLVGAFLAPQLVIGGKLFGKYRITPVRKVLYCVLEDPIRRFQARLNDMKHAFGPLPEGHDVEFLRMHDFSLTDESDTHFLWLGKKVRDEGHDVVFLDTYQKATPGLLSYDDVTQSRIFHKLNGFVRATGRLLIVLDHVRQTPAGHRRNDLTLDDLKGTGGKAQNADCVILMQRTADRKQIKFQAFSKDFDEPVRILLNVAPRGSTEPKFSYAGDMDALGETSAAKGRRNRQAVLDAMELDQRYGREDLMKATGLGHSAVSEHLKSLIEEGRIADNGERGKKHRYWIIRPGEKGQPDDRT